LLIPACFVAHLDLKQGGVDRVGARFEDRKLQAFLAAMRHEIFGVQHFRVFLVGPGVAHDVAGRKLGAVTRHNPPVETVRDRHDGEVAHVVEDVEER
jgi:hypothetical protein